MSLGGDAPNFVPNGIEQVFNNKRGGEIARATGFSIDKEHDRYKTEGDNHVLPY